MSFRLDQVTFQYPGGPVVLRDLNLTLPPGQTIAILGLSGLGKTTLLNLLGLLWDRGPTRGEILYSSSLTGKESLYSQMKPHQQADLRRHEFGLVPQVSHFLSGFTCGQNLTIPLALQGFHGRAIPERIDQLLALARASGSAGEDLPRALKDYPTQVSTGQRQRLSVLRAVAHDPVVLFADEPVSNLDDQNKQLMLELFRAWRNNDLRFPGRPALTRTLLFVCHEAETAWEMADSFLFLIPPLSREIHQKGANAELLSREEFCREHALDPGDAQLRFTGPEALRRHLRRSSTPIVA